MTLLGREYLKDPALVCLPHRLLLTTSMYPTGAPWHPVGPPRLLLQRVMAVHRRSGMGQWISGERRAQIQLIMLHWFGKMKGAST